MKIKVTLNGTSVNPNHKFGFTRSPFPQIAKAEYAWVDRLLANLDADPIRDAAHLKQLLVGCSPEFVELCVQQFKPGERVSFFVTFPEGG